MNILIINHYAGSPSYGMEFRPYYLAREWIQQGHQVTVLGASYSHLRQRNPNVQFDFQEEEIEGIKYVWLKTPRYVGSLARIRNIMTFVWKLQRNAKKITKRYSPDLVIASSTYPIDNIPSHKIAKIRGAKYAYEIHDLWPLSPMLIGGYSKHHPFIVAMQWGENYAYKHVDKVISLLWNAEAHCREHGLPDGRFVCVPNGYDPREWDEEAFNLILPPEHRIRLDFLKDKIVVGFAGGFAASGALMTFVEAAKELNDRSDLHFVLVGKGPEEDNLKSYVASNSLTNVTFLPAVSKTMIPSLISHFDIAYMGGTHSLLHKYGTSYNKMTDYMLSAKPIVQAIDEPGSVVERIGCGIRVEAENPSDVAKAIVKIASMNVEDRQKMGSKGRIYAQQNLKWRILADKLVSSFQSNSLK